MGNLVFRYYTMKPEQFRTDRYLYPCFFQGGNEYASFSQGFTQPVTSILADCVDSITYCMLHKISTHQLLILRSVTALAWRLYNTVTCMRRSNESYCSSRLLGAYSLLRMLCRRGSWQNTR